LNLKKQSHIRKESHLQYIGTEGEFNSFINEDPVKPKVKADDMNRQSFCEKFKHEIFFGKYCFL